MREQKTADFLKYQRRARRMAALEQVFEAALEMFTALADPFNRNKPKTVEELLLAVREVEALPPLEK